MSGAKRIPTILLLPVVLWMLPLLLTVQAGFSQTQTHQPSGQFDTFHAQNCSTAGCHPIDRSGGTLHHPPYLESDCLACHQPHIDATHAPLRPDQPALCAGCHPGTETDPIHEVLHPPSTGSSRSCLDCHNPHTSRVRNLLRNEDQLASCLQCHQATLDRAETAPYQHHYFNPQRECGSCHFTHQNRETHFLRPNVRETCLSCHYMPIQTPGRPLKNIAMEIRTKPVVHQVVMEQGCPTCHTPHGSTQPSLMRDGYPSGAYAAYQRENFALCWQCHDKDLVEAAVTSTATEFRDGARNLHQLHIMGLNKGRSCHLCHEAHASDRPHLLRNTIRFNEWNAPFIWEPQPSGATCTTPCHLPQSYDRAIPPPQ